MSHIPLRKEKDCLNCGTQVQGRYCHVCGQENVVPKETFWHMVTHFFYDLTHFDSSFFRTLRILIFKPGFLSNEYVKGRRVTYLHPIRMYVFTSAIFFLFFFSVFKPLHTVIENLDEPIEGSSREALVTKYEKQAAAHPKDTNLLRILNHARDTSRVITGRDVLGSTADTNIVTISGMNYRDKKQYDSMEHTLPPSKRDGWLTRRIVLKVLAINDKYKGNPEKAFEDLKEGFLHRLPYMLLISLPLFALILKLIYIRRKTFYYADHGVFTLHLYVFTFILLLVIFALDNLSNALGMEFLGIVQFLLVLTLYFYLYKAMRNFYKQGRFKTFMKFLLVSLISLIMMTILFAGMVMFSASQL